MRRHGACARAPQLRARRALQLAMHGICMQISFHDMHTQSFDADTRMANASGKVQTGESFTALFRDLLLCWSIKHDWYLGTKYLFCAGRPLWTFCFGRSSSFWTSQDDLLLNSIQIIVSYKCSFWVRNWKGNPSEF